MLWSLGASDAARRAVSGDPKNVPNNLLERVLSLVKVVALLDAVAVCCGPR